jgi:hypothetical protein
VLLAPGPQLDYPGSLPNSLIGRQLAQLLCEAGVPVRVLVEAAAATDWPQGIGALFLAGADPATAPNRAGRLARAFRQAAHHRLPFLLAKLARSAISLRASQRDDCGIATNNVPRFKSLVHRGLIQARRRDVLRQ